MRKKPELEFLRTIKTGKGLIKLINSLQTIRGKSKVNKTKRSSLSSRQRKLILDKTDSRCHICGIDLSITDFQADHVKSHSSGGVHAENNYLPSCFTCNNYRWHYTSEEIQIILKLGVWAKTKAKNNSKFGLEIANEFVKHEMSLRRRRKAKEGLKKKQ